MFASIFILFFENSKSQARKLLNLFYPCVCLIPRRCFLMSFHVPIPKSYTYFCKKWWYMGVWTAQKYSADHSLKLPLCKSFSHFSFPGCMPHNQMEACQNSVTGEATCESPCLDYVSASKHFQSCLNLYSRTSTSDPPPCLPPQYRNDSSELTKLELRMVLDERAFGLQPGGMSSPNLPPCSGEVPLGDRPLKRRSPADPDNQQEARKKFIVYVVCVVLLLILVQCGLKRKRISAFIRSRWFSANNTG